MQDHSLLNNHLHQNFIQDERFNSQMEYLLLKKHVLLLGIVVITAYIIMQFWVLQISHSFVYFTFLCIE